MATKKASKTTKSKAVTPDPSDVTTTPEGEGVPAVGDGNVPAVTADTTSVAAPEIDESAEESAPNDLSDLELAAEEEAERKAAETEPEPQEPVTPKTTKAKASTRRTTKKTKEPDDKPVKSAKSESKTRREQNIERKEREEQRAERLERNQAFFAGISSLQAAMKRKTILHGQVVAVETVSTAGTRMEGQGNMVVVSVMVEDRFKVQIPFVELFRDNAIDPSTVDLNTREGRSEYERRQRQMSEKMYGDNIEFIVTNIVMDSPEDYAISGSRRDALAIMEARNFGGSNPRYKVGGTYPAKILSVGNHNMFVSLGGVDCSIPLRDVTFEYCPVLTQKYEAGSDIDVEILEAKPRPKDGRMVLSLSGKGPELASALAKQRTGIISVGTRTLGQITNVHKSNKHPGKIVIRAWLPHFGMPVIVLSMLPSDLGAAPKAGDIIRLQVVDFTENGFVVARCNGFQNASRVLNSRG